MGDKKGGRVRDGKRDEWLRVGKRRKGFGSLMVGKGEGL